MLKGGDHGSKTATEKRFKQPVVKVSASNMPEFCLITIYHGTRWR
jgi:hypothetical protein